MVNKMGNRAVITTRQNFENNGIGIYLHWNGGRDSITAFLTYCKLHGYRSPNVDDYGWASLCSVISNFFENRGTSIGIDCVNNLDCNNYDNGVYLIENWKIVGREYFNGVEQSGHDLLNFLLHIDEKMPVNARLGEEFIKNNYEKVCVE